MRKPPVSILGSDAAKAQWIEWLSMDSARDVRNDGRRSIPSQSMQAVVFTCFSRIDVAAHVGGGRMLP